jgi:hypothetical protein
MFGLGALMVLPGCSDPFKLPWAPSELTTGIAIYEHANYRGAAAHITQDIDLRDPDEGPCPHDSGDEYSGQYWNWEDCVSSVRVAPGWRAILYRNGSFKGDMLEVTQDTANLQLVKGDCDHDGFNDCVSSIRVFRP